MTKVAGEGYSGSSTLIGLAALLLWLLSPSPLQAESSAIQGHSPSEFAFPDSLPVRSYQSEAAETYVFILSPVESAARELQIDESIRLPAHFSRETWEMPRNATFSEIREYLRGSLRERGFTTLFECEGRDCGRSDLWANHIWQLAVLYGPNTSQFYIAMQDEDRGLLAALYLVERGNRRIYANLDIVEPVEMPQFETASRIASQLHETGRVRLDGSLPSSAWLRGLREGLSDAVRQSLAPVAEQLSLFSGQRVYVVCHLYGTESTEELLEASYRWASLLVAELAVESGPELIPFGVGPLSPVSGEVGANRVELVLPERN